MPLATVRRHFAAHASAVSRQGIYPHCGACDYRTHGICRGGCLAHVLRGLQHAPATTSPRPAPATAATPHAPAGRRQWSIPYIDQPAPFWEDIANLASGAIGAVYFPISAEIIGSGRPPQPAAHMADFLAGPLAKAVLVNPLVLPQPVEECAPAILAYLERLQAEYGITQATVANLPLARRIKERFPDFRLTASVLLDIGDPAQIALLEGLFDVLVPSGRCLRDRRRLAALRAAFPGKIRLLVNEACLPGCVHRLQHFYEMAAHPECSKSLCAETLARAPWLTLTGTWILPQHLHHYDDLADEYKLSGRVTLADPARYRRVLQAYLLGLPLSPDRIGGGPASVPLDLPISEAFFTRTFTCAKNCSSCTFCREYYARYQPPHA